MSRKVMWRSRANLKRGVDQNLRKKDKLSQREAQTQVEDLIGLQEGLSLIAVVVKSPLVGTKSHLEEIKNLSTVVVRSLLEMVVQEAKDPMVVVVILTRVENARSIDGYSN